MLENNPDKVKLVFKNFPLSFHKQALPAAQAALAAHNQGKFWEFHDRIFAAGPLQDDTYKKIATALGLDMTKFEADQKSPLIRSRIMNDLQQGRQAEVNSTPSIFINGWRFEGQRTPQGFQQKIDEELAQLKNTKK